MLIQLMNDITLEAVAHIQEREFGTQNELEKLMIYDIKNA